MIRPEVITYEIFKQKWANLLLNICRRRSQVINKPFDLTKTFILNLWEKQNGKCTLTNMVFRVAKQGADDETRRPFVPSIDRISSKGGYTKNNVRIVTVAVNMALFTWGDSVFDEVVISRYNVLKNGAIDIPIDLIIAKYALMKSESFEKQITDRQLEIEELKQHIKLLRTGRIEPLLKLPTGWFSMRRKHNQTLPDPVTVEGPMKCPRYVYNYYDVVRWLRNHPQEEEWCPQGCRIVESKITGQKYYQKIKEVKIRCIQQL